MRAGIDPTLLDLRFLSDRNLQDDALVREAVAAVARLEPDLVGLYCNSAVFPFLSEFATAIRERLPGAHITLGGPHATFLSQEILDFNKSIDSIVRGEAEITLLELIRSLQTDNRQLDKIAGLSYRNNSHVFHNKSRRPLSNVDELPIPDFTLFPALQTYQSERRKIFVPILGSRGCPFNCSFCAARAMWGHQRRRDPHEVITEMKVRMCAYGVDIVFGFLDDEFTCSRQWVTSVCDGIRREKLHTQWTAFSRVDTVSPDLLRRLRDSGCINLYYGIESGSQKVLDSMNKGFSTVRAIQTVRDTLKAGIEPTASFILGFPNETTEDMSKTIDLAVQMTEIGARVHLFPFCVLPGTPLWDSNVQVTRVPNFKHLTLGPKRPFITKYSHIQWCVPDAWVCKLKGISPDSFQKIFEFALETVMRAHSTTARSAAAMSKASNLGRQNF